MEFRKGLEVASRIMKAVPGVRPMLDALQAYKEGRRELTGRTLLDSMGEPFGNPGYAETLKRFYEVSTGGPIGRMLGGVSYIREIRVRH